MSFVEQEDVFQAVEPVLRDLFVEFADGKPVKDVFPRIPYDELRSLPSLTSSGLYSA